jgi:superfamily II DNA or RNA helicase
MSGGSLQERYDQFQDQAVANIVSDFSQRSAGRFLLVIPTGGGKTFTAVKAVNRLFEVGVLNVAEDRVLWTAHRTELITQAIDTFKSFQDRYPQRPSFASNVDFLMIGDAKEAIKTSKKIKLVVIDEAHHAALKNISYRPIFVHSDLGILGLTATPSRHDGEPLEFDRESFSIGFPDLVKRGIVLKPDVRKVEGGTFDLSNLDDEASLEQLNTEARNKKIIAELLAHPDDYKKVIIYLGTINHVKSLYRQIIESPLKANYESISFITGKTNSRNQDRDQFIKEEKGFKRSILINVMVLSEGYDDPSVNTVVMATPSQSKLYYMQAMGRAIRSDLSDPLKKAFCIEVEDRLPNIKYRIDNRWLFSDVSDSLEPSVIDREYGTGAEFAESLGTIYKEYGVPIEQHYFPPFKSDQRYTLLLFRRYLAPGNYVHFPLVITNDNRLQISSVFNFLSERMAQFREQGVIGEAAFRMAGSNAFALLPNEKERRWVYEAMTHSLPPTKVENQPKFIADGYPWITFVAFHYRRPDLPDELLKFVADMVNQDDILELIRCRDFEEGSYLLRLPLPLKSSMGRIVTASEFGRIDSIIRRLRTLRNEKGFRDHRGEIHDLLAGSIIPIEFAHADSLILIARTDEPYCIKLG